MDIVIRLRELRRIRGLSQREVSRLTGIGFRTISGFETGARIGSMKLEQLESLLKVYGVSESEFFSEELELMLTPWDAEKERNQKERLLHDIESLPEEARHKLLPKIRTMLKTAAEIYETDFADHMMRVRDTDWQLMVNSN
jgi:transcriptional regulator with XRE-family HTH domain